MATWDDYMAYKRRVDLSANVRELSQVPDTQGPDTQIPDTQGSDTQGPDMQGPETQGLEMQPPTDPATLMTLEQLLRSPGRANLNMLDPRRTNGAGWFEYTKGITKTVKKIMESDFSEPAPNWSALSSDTKLRWFKAFAQKYNWLYEQTTLVREEFDRLCKSRILGIVYVWKQDWKNKKGKPEWMRNSVWLGLIAYWVTEKNANRSVTNSGNRRSRRNGLGMAKHTCGSMPYVRRREMMQNEETGELPDMVTFMEATHKRKSNGLFVCKKAELIAKKCRALEQQILSQRTQDDDDPIEPNHLTLIFEKEVQVKESGRFGYGSIPKAADPNAIDTSAFFEEKYMETQEELNKANKKIDEMGLKLKDVDFWASIMRSAYPNLVPPSMRASGNQDL